MDVKKENAKVETVGTKIAMAGRAACNNISDEERQRLTALAMQLIYHNHTGASAVSVNRH